FAKRQRTWFRQSPNLEYFDMNNSNLLESVWQRINQFV
ncbi:MAG: tRNA (adenosine(37)-N6)-dimethylallyltransferase MiaA, partial [Dolichospermum sp.]